MNVMKMSTAIMIMEGASRRRKLGDLLPPQAKHADLIKLPQSIVMDLIQGLAQGPKGPGFSFQCMHDRFLSTPPYPNISPPLNMSKPLTFHQPLYMSL